jgi:undecaprenyl-diphosphatase
VRQASPSLPLGRAVVLGLLHGPSELLPISSSGHTALFPWLAGWDHDELDPAARKRFEVALHAGVLLAVRHELARSVAGARGPRLVVITFASLPALVAGLTLERLIERRLGGPASVAAGLLAGSAAMIVAESRGAGVRRAAEATALDGALLGVAQALALVPGVSRSGATLSAARARGFAPADARELAFELGLPVTLGAVALKARELDKLERAEWAALAAGALAAYASSAATASLARRLARGRSLLPYAAYRGALAAAVLRRLRQNARR